MKMQQRAMLMVGGWGVLPGEQSKVFFQISNTTTTNRKLNKIVRNSHLKVQESDEKACNNLETYSRVSFESQWPSGKETTCNAKIQVQSLGQEYPLEKQMETHSSILAWEIPWTEVTGSP